MNAANDMETAARDIANDYLINPQSVEMAFTQHILLLIHKREMKEISFKEYASFIAICSFTTKIAIEKSEAKPSQVH
jgi:hypothetical protein